MKTTVEIPDSLLKRARKIAVRDGTTIRTLIEESLRRVLDEREQTRGFKLRHVTFGGEGLHPDLQGSSWSDVLDLSYRGRGA